MEQFILKENVLTNNILFVAEDGKVFKGNCIAIIKEYVFQNSWSDKELIKKFRSKETLVKYLNKKYPNFKF
jgi:hypothetical protein